MIRKSKYKTLSGQIAEISQVTARGGIGWVEGVPTAWRKDGTSLGRADHSLVTWSVLTLPKMRLAEPMRDAPETDTVCYLFDPAETGPVAVQWVGTREQMDWLGAGQLHMLESSAQEYCDFWAKYIGGKPPVGVKS